MDAEQALTALIHKHGGFIRRFLTHRGARRDDVEDLLQDIFLAAWEKGFPDSDNEARPYLLVIARFILFNYRRKQARHAAKLTAESSKIADNTTSSQSSAQTPIDALASLERTRNVHEFLESLSTVQRKALELVYLDELTHSQAAKELGVSRKTIYAWKETALNTLRKLPIEE